VLRDGLYDPEVVSVRSVAVSLRQVTTHQVADQHDNDEPASEVIVPIVDIRDATDADEVLRARRLHGARYLAEGYVDHLSETGTIDDPYVAHSEYIVATDPASGDLVGTCRLITSDVHALPLLEHMAIDDEWSHVLRTTPSALLAEVSALATPRGNLGHFVISAALCREVIQRSLRETRRKYLLCIVDGRLLRVLNRVFKLGLVAIGPTQQYMGTTIPAVLELDGFVEHMQSRRDDTAEFFLEGLTLDELDAVVIDLREHALRPVAPPSGT
jgi:hypothetical protein